MIFLYKIPDFFICVKVLIENGADPNKKDMFGNTALDIAKENGKIVIKKSNEILIHKYSQSSFRFHGHHRAVITNNK